MKLAPRHETTSGRIRTSSRHPLGGHRHTTNIRESQYQIRVEGAIIEHGAITGSGFLVGETITGATSGKTGLISEVGAGYIVYSTQNNSFTDAETISNNEAIPTTAVVTTHDTGSHVWHDYFNAAIMLQAGTRAADRAVVQSARYYPYIEGLDHADAITAVFGSQENANQYAIYGDDENGTGVMMEGTKKATLLRTNTSGTPIDYVSYASKLAGFRRWINGFSVDFTFGNIFENEFRWLGYGDMIKEVTISGIRRMISRRQFAGKQREPSMRTPTLPIRVEVKNTGVTLRPTQARFVCAGIFSEGGITAPGYSLSYGTGLHESRTIANGAFRPLGAWRVKSSIGGHPNRITAELKDFVATIAGANATVYLYHMHGVREVAGGAWLTPSVHDPVEYNMGITSITADERHLIQLIPVYPGGAAGKGGLGSIDTTALDNHKYISSNLESENVPGNYSEMFYAEIHMEANVDGEASGHCTFSLFE